jgi:extracellular factor (EF) 3-hydroxypalmitic acid methyl ester biosynthesis protein
MFTKDLIIPKESTKTKDVSKADDDTSLIVPNQHLDLKTLTSVGSKILNSLYKKRDSKDQILDLTQDIWTKMHVLKNATSLKNWQTFIATSVDSHPLKAAFKEDPAVKRSIDQPRGYPGDAGLLDYYYGFSKINSNITPMGLTFLTVNVNVPAAWAVRARLKILANYIDNTLNSVSGTPRILSIACGYLRELHYSNQIKHRPSEFFALDHDEKSLSIVQKDWGSLVQTCKMSVFSLLRGSNLGLGQFDLIYAAGLYDYLNKETAMHLSKYLLTHINPGGKLIITNFLNTSNCSACLEAFMNWHLIYRSIEDMEALFLNINAEGIYSKKIYTEENNQIVFLEISKNI